VKKNVLIYLRLQRLCERCPHSGVMSAIMREFWRSKRGCCHGSPARVKSRENDCNINERDTVVSQ